MISHIFNYPEQAFYGRVLTKSKIYEHAKPSNAVKQKIIEQIDKIVWQYKLSPETINLPAKHNISEIQVFDIKLKSSDLSDSVLECIDSSIPFPIFYQIRFGGKIKLIASYKRYISSTCHWVVEKYFSTPWVHSEHSADSLPIALDLYSLYEQMLRKHISIPAREGETISQQVERVKRINFKQDELKKTEGKLRKEKQFNRKIELNEKLGKIKCELNSLSMSTKWIQI